MIYNLLALLMLFEAKDIVAHYIKDRHYPTITVNGILDIATIIVLNTTLVFFIIVVYDFSGWLYLANAIFYGLLYTVRYSTLLLKYPGRWHDPLLTRSQILDSVIDFIIQLSYLGMGLYYVYRNI